MSAHKCNNNIKSKKKNEKNKLHFGIGIPNMNRANWEINSDRAHWQKKMKTKRRQQQQNLIQYTNNNFHLDKSNNRVKHEK